MRIDYPFAIKLYLLTKIMQVLFSLMLHILFFNEHFFKTSHNSLFLFAKDVNNKMHEIIVKNQTEHNRTHHVLQNINFEGDVIYYSYLDLLY